MLKNRFCDRPFPREISKISLEQLVGKPAGGGFFNIFKYRLFGMLEVLNRTSHIIQKTSISIEILKVAAEEKVIFSPFFAKWFNYALVIPFFFFQDHIACVINNILTEDTSIDNLSITLLMMQ